MRSPRYHPISALLILTLAGCGTIPGSFEGLEESGLHGTVATSQDDASRSTDVIDADLSPDTQLPAAAQVPIDPSSAVPSPMSDLGFPLSDLALIPDLLSSFVDGLLLDMLQPSIPQSNLSFLEQLCRDSDIPDFRCRQLYGNW